MAAKKKAKKTKKAVKKAVKRTAKKMAPARKAAKKMVKAKTGAPAKEKTQIIGEGNYAASRAFDKDQAGFVKKNKARILALGKAAEKALEGPEGAALRAAEAAGLARSRDTF